MIREKRGRNHNSRQEGAIIHSAAQFSALTRLFSAHVLHKIAKKGRSGLFRQLIAETPLNAHCETEATVGDAFDSAFDILRVAGQRNEYVYRAAISHKILMGRHS